MGAAFGRAGAGKAPGRQKAGMLFLGAAALSLLMPRTWRANRPDPAAPPSHEPSPPAAAPVEAPAQPALEPARPPRRMWALVQLRPDTAVLALSASRAELERELAELNETWNHWELRVERQRYAIQAAPVLYAGIGEPNAPVRKPQGSQASGL